MRSAWIRKWSIIVLAAILLGIVLFRMDVRKVWEYTGEIRWKWVLLATIVNLVATWFEAVRWKLILMRVKKGLGITRVFGATLAGIFGNTVMPFRLGDGFRAYYLAEKARISFASSLSTVMLDYLINTAFFVIFALIVFLLYPFPFHHPVLIVSVLLATGALILTGALFPRHRFTRWLCVRFGGKIPGRISRFSAGFAALRDAGILFYASAISILLWGMKIFMVWCMMRAYQLDLDMIAAAVVMVLTNIGIGIVSTPANIGGYELATIAGLALFGVEVERAASFAVVFHMVEVVPVMIIGFLVVAFSGMNFREMQTGYQGERRKEK